MNTRTHTRAAVAAAVLSLTLLHLCAPAWEILLPGWLLGGETDE
ncbi:MAG: hypothetical protein ACREIA_01355 [Opitutaceae bacterium]